MAAAGENSFFCRLAGRDDNLLEVVDAEQLSVSIRLTTTRGDSHCQFELDDFPPRLSLRHSASGVGHREALEEPIHLAHVLK